MNLPNVAFTLGALLYWRFSVFPTKKKKKEREGGERKTPQKYTSFHFISDELFFAWEMDERWLQEAARSDTFHQASLRGPKVIAMHLFFFLFFKRLPRF